MARTHDGQRDFSRGVADILRALRARAHAIVPVVVLFTGGALVLGRTKPKMYTAKARVLIESSASRFMNNLPEYGSVPYFFLRNEMMTKAMEMKNIAVAERVVQVLRLSEEERFRAVGPGALAEMVRGWTAVEPVADTRLLEITCETPDPDLSFRVADAYADAYVAVTIERRRQQLNKANALYEMKIPEVDEKLSEIEKRLAGMEAHVVSSNEGPEATLRERDLQLQRQLSDAQQERIEAQAALVGLKAVSAEDGAFLERARDMAATDAWVRRLFEQRLALGERLLELRRSYREGHPELATVEAKLSEVDRELREAARGFVERAHRAFEAAQWKEAEVSRLLAGHRAEAARLRSEFHRYEALKRQRDSYRAILDPLVKGRTELGLAATLDFASVVVETRPTRPGGPSRPNLVMHGLAGFAFGCVVAFGLALLLESLDETVRTPDDIVGAASLATVGVISRMGRGMARNARATALVAATQPGSIAGEQFRSLRTGILSLDGWSGRFRSGVVLVTSTDLGEGKTTVALNAAAVFSQLGQKAVVVDADLRRAAVHSALDIERVPGLVEYLEGSAKLADVVRPTRLPNLFVVPAGKATASPAEALAGPRAREIIEELKKEYATVWIDSPPVMPVGDARGLAPAADLVLVVVRSVVTRRRALKRTCELLTSESGRAVAAVLNCVPRSAEHQVGYRYQSRYYTSGARPDGGDE